MHTRNTCLEPTCFGPLRSSSARTSGNAHAGANSAGHATRRPLPAMLLGPLLGVLVSLTGCQSSPGLPTVDDSQRRPINQAAAIELQTCKAEASALRASLAETAGPQCGKTSSTMAMAPQAFSAKGNGPLTSSTAADAVPEGAATRLAVFVFEQNQTSLSADEETRAALTAAAHQAHTVHIRARSGNSAESSVDTLAARRRAESAAALLRELGVPAQKLRVSWQGLGEAPVDGLSGRRVELEFVAQAPALLFTKPAQAQQGPTQTASTVPRPTAAPNPAAEARANVMAQALAGAAASAQRTSQASRP
ncbi:MAG: hypothetical protein LW854_22635 [Rubrivivax sp.]|nr:hypothetical protein [Rubrivivax sp.]